MKKKKVIVYTTSNCHYCEKVIDFFRLKEVEVDERNVSDHSDYYNEWKQINSMGTPLTVYKNHHVLGYSEKKLNDLF